MNTMNSLGRLSDNDVEVNLPNRRIKHEDEALARIKAQPWKWPTELGGLQY